MDAKHLLYLVLHIRLEWLIRIIVLTSMSLQLLLIVLGARRYLSSNRLLRSVVWLAYVSADAVATSALGTMMHHGDNLWYAIWAPLLLLHLGGPDAITAYSTPDNELWLRHGFTMVYQILVAVYVIYVSKLKGNLLVAAILLLIAGGTKYAERTVALTFASYSHIVSSTQPIYKFMEHEHEILPEGCNYLVVGEKQFYDKFQLAEDVSTALVDPGQGMITIKNVWEQEGSEVTEDYILCLSYALFKMYKRRFVNLNFHEGIRPKIRKFFFSGDLRDNVFRIVEMELKFMYDALFSKSSRTAYSIPGALMRLLNICFLSVAGFLIYSGLTDKVTKQPAPRTLTYVLVSVALAVEFYQVCRVMVSDWTMVSLICAQIQYRKLILQRNCVQWYTFKLKLIQIIMCVLRKVRKQLQNQYWKNGIEQYSLIDTCIKTRSSYIWKVFDKPDNFVVLWYIKARNIKAGALQNDLKLFIFDKLKVICSPADEDIVACRERVYAFDQCLTDLRCEDLQWATKRDLDILILTWHIATTICESERTANGGTHSNSNEQNKNVRFSRTLSRYCAYLLVSRPNLLPLHADIARMENMKVHKEIVQQVNENGYNNASMLKYYRSTTALVSETTLGSGTKLARQLLDKPGIMWEILAEYWAGLLIYIAVYSKATFHAECLTSGGEFLSQVWVLLGHMGCGEQSDSAVTKRIEDKYRKEKEDQKNMTTAREEERREHNWHRANAQVRRQWN